MVCYVLNKLKLFCNIMLVYPIMFDIRGHGIEKTRTKFSKCDSDVAISKITHCDKQRLKAISFHREMELLMGLNNPASSFSPAIPRNNFRVEHLFQDGYEVFSPASNTL